MCVAGGGGGLGVTESSPGCGEGGPAMVRGTSRERLTSKHQCPACFWSRSTRKTRCPSSGHQ